MIRYEFVNTLIVSRAIMSSSLVGITKTLTLDLLEDTSLPLEVLLRFVSLSS